jgi:glycosyltransferase involved in cell wall biosynthesis
MRGSTSDHVHSRSTPRIFVGLVEVAGYYAGLVGGLRELGVQVTHVNLQENIYYPYPSPNGSWVVEISNRLTKLFHIAQRRRSTKWLFKPVRTLHIGLLFLWAILKHDVFIFSFGGSFFSLRELPAYKLFGKKLIFVFSGSDTRPPYLSGLYVADPVVPLQVLSAISAESKRRVIRIEKYATVCVNHSLSAQFHEKPFVNFLQIGNPGSVHIALPDSISAKSDHLDGIRIVHAPSRPVLKGSARFSEMISRLRGEGTKIVYIDIRNRPQAEVIEELARCDFVLDELYSDMTLAGLGTEAASLGKPVLVGGYAKEALKVAAHGVPMPFDTYCSPHEVEAQLQRLVTDQQWRRVCGEKARRFVQDCWQPRMLAEKILRLADGDIPADWLVDPQDITYFHGWGVSEEALRQRLEALISFGGIGGLQLGDKPALERAVLEFSQNRSGAATMTRE